ncbi:helix-turn-helix domain-containing protein [Niabella drilacis]|uniref:Helix-turn-helix n=1 Tax=Niabella drilacis (strain DSM 25811 / CCM 8410 / CCUG 62505 / LMG 26954 / E90) TaxID=1285928 RepID=A0A1G6QZ04_NIADE|nr:helix-turn-helix transcriptional regulator [Niabella drilacis]SDC96886.1 Helix-turn-helix [Niabella drilacis]
MKNQEEILSKLKEVATVEQSDWIKDADYRHENKGWLLKSQLTAIQILRALKNQHLSQKDLAAKLNVSPQQVNKWVKGQENFTYETVDKIERALGIRITNIAGEFDDEKTEVVVKKTSEYQKADYSMPHFQQSEISKTTTLISMKAYTFEKCAPTPSFLEAV